MPGRTPTTRRLLFELAAELWRRQSITVDTPDAEFRRLALELAPSFSARPVSAEALRAALKAEGTGGSLTGLLWKIATREPSDSPLDGVESRRLFTQLVGRLGEFSSAADELRGATASGDLDLAAERANAALEVLRQRRESLEGPRPLPAGPAGEKDAAEAANLAVLVAKVTYSIFEGTAVPLAVNAVREYALWERLWQRHVVPRMLQQDAPRIRWWPASGFNVDRHIASWPGLLVTLYVNSGHDLGSALDQAREAAQGLEIPRRWPNADVLSEAGLALLNAGRTVEAQAAFESAQAAPSALSEAAVDPFCILGARLALHAAVDGDAEVAKGLLRSLPRILDREEWEAEQDDDTDPDPDAPDALDAWLDYVSARFGRGRELLEDALSLEGGRYAVIEWWLRELRPQEAAGPFSHVELAALLLRCLWDTYPAGALERIAAMTGAAELPSTELDRMLMRRLDDLAVARGVDARTPHAVAASAQRAMYDAVLSTPLWQLAWVSDIAAVTQAMPASIRYSDTLGP